MKLRMPVRHALLPMLWLACVATGPMRAQQLIGYVSTRDAEVTGATDVVDGRAVLTGSVSVTAKDHTAPIALGRGGTVRVCQTSVLHLTESRAVEVAAPLLFSLDRGAIEIQMRGTPNDSIMTPDLRFTVRNDGPLDLRLRIARNGDTCVENRGPLAPTLAISDPFGEAMYELQPGQHVLFEHGSLREVVDHETSPCGCPDEQGMSIADALLAPGSGAAAPAKPPLSPAATVPASSPAVPVHHLRLHRWRVPRPMCRPQSRLRRGPRCKPPNTTPRILPRSRPPSSIPSQQPSVKGSLPRRRSPRSRPARCIPRSAIR